jgi:uncharacterized protein (DUF305 family)
VRIRHYAAGVVLAATLATVAVLHQGSPSPSVGARPAAVRVTKENAPPNAADVAFAQMMIAHHAQAVTMSESLLSKKGVPERIRAIADFVAHDQTREIGQMTEWLTAWNMPAESHYHAMPAAAPDESNGADAGRIYLRRMIEHHRGAIVMARDRLAGGGANVYIHGLAKHVINEQTAENAAMAALL